MTRLGDARAAIVAALEAGGLRPTTGVRVRAAGIHVEPGDPWSAPARLPGRTSRWRLTAVAGKADAEASFDMLCDLLERADAALRTVDGCQLPTWGKPTDYTLEGVPYAAAVAEITLPLADPPSARR